jgi:hypothetical protein
MTLGPKMDNSPLPTLTIPIKDRRLPAIIMAIADLVNGDCDEIGTIEMFWTEDLPEALYWLFINLGAASFDGYELAPGDLASGEWLKFRHQVEYYLKRTSLKDES